ncbi:uncharacterized protein B0I36DRAFT_334568 [Microdochium trichocladiopsis]|uniref:Uncharacterized protein n=1 Tax=Microdochium trichocladiopsis TaxID=1682393 RepID=A0A9P8XWR5_9PEZI|nr:uncharacterized protein B0I36DRAFT_338064 [Microdochium trichocladiopsis]XP_046007716.1 uncharacterized protein B0I36DRAFT_334568 [Microdochium trichocladiopsis]KAH7016550.1 hypothetical protein B0I36DRAFT_338064 [Microdochium trichocladiopsis]KAH7021515.1 hypothetical protein B0I36DRAFT_334568 [Microdochium trichocladiopsis]
MQAISQLDILLKDGTEVEFSERGDALSSVLKSLCRSYRLERRMSTGSGVSLDLKVGSRTHSGLVSIQALWEATKRDTSPRDEIFARRILSPVKERVIVAYVDRRAVRTRREERRRQERSWNRGPFPAVDENRDPYIVATMIASAQQTERGSGSSVVVIDVATEDPQVVAGTFGGRRGGEQSSPRFLVHSAYIPARYFQLFEIPYKAPERLPIVQVRSQSVQIWPYREREGRLQNILDQSLASAARERDKVYESPTPCPSED